VGTDHSRQAPKGYLRDTASVKQADKFNGAMGKPERKALVLAFLDDTRRLRIGVLSMPIPTIGAIT